MGRSSVRACVLRTPERARLPARGDLGACQEAPPQVPGGEYRSAQHMIIRDHRVLRSDHDGAGDGREGDAVVLLQENFEQEKAALARLEKAATRLSCRHAVA